jgi:hypothetical protein
MGYCGLQTGVFLCLTRAGTSSDAHACVRVLVRGLRGIGTGNVVEVREMGIRGKRGREKMRGWSALEWRFSWKWTLGRQWIRLLGVDSLNETRIRIHAYSNRG